MHYNQVINISLNLYDRTECFYTIKKGITENIYSCSFSSNIINSLLIIILKDFIYFLFYSITNGGVIKSDLQGGV